MTLEEINDAVSTMGGLKAFRIVPKMDDTYLEVDSISIELHGDEPVIVVEVCKET